MDAHGGGARRIQWQQNQAGVAPPRWEEWQMETLRPGSTGAHVSMLQLGLQRSGYYEGNLDGIYGAQTTEAVRRFQRAFGLSVDGVTGPQTWNAVLPFVRGYVVRRVQQGDTFWNLAQRYSTTVRAIATANPGVDPQALRIGQSLTIPLRYAVVPTNLSYSYALLGEILDGLQARYPFLWRGNAGKSTMGKPLPLVRIGTGGVEVFYNAAFHSNEWITTPVLLKFLEEYAAAYARGGEIGGVSAETLYRRATLYLMPMVNPDAVDLVTGALQSGDAYSNAARLAKNYPDIPFPAGWKANIVGIDPNVQFPANWEKARDLKFAAGYRTPGPREYPGTAPLTAAESRSVYDLTRNHDFALMLAYHTQGSIIYWKYLDYEPPRSREIGEKMSQASGYPLELTPEGSSYAGYKDWYIQDYNRPGYTVEVGLGQNPLPISQFDEIYRANLGILTIGLTEASYIE